MSNHAILGASKASMWVNCPGWRNGFTSLPESERERTSDAADEGTAAHTLGEYVIKNDFSTAREFIGKSLKGKVKSWPVTREMADAVDIWHDSVRDHVARLEKKYPGEKVTVVLEQVVKPFSDRDDMFGTADTIIYCASEIVVIDFKYGVGTVVEIEFNDQLMYYGLGALEFGASEADEIVLEIVQPRARHEDGIIRAWPIKRSVLEDYAAVLRAAATYSMDPAAPRIAGDHCKPFCPMATRCHVLAEYATATAVSDFEALPELVKPAPEHVNLPDIRDSEAISRAMKLAPLVEFWAKKVREMAEELAKAGVEVKGYKLVRKKANRKWNDDADLERRLRNRGIKVGDIFNQKLRSPKQIEDLDEVGKKWVAKHCHKPEGGLTLVPLSDKRLALQPGAIADFQDVPLPELPATVEPKEKD